MTVNYDITEDVPYDISAVTTDTRFTLTDTAYDVVIDNIPFILKIDNQNPYIRQTAQYRKEQFDNSTEPGEQSLTGWWLRSQTSFHNGAGAEYYEPGTDAALSSHRFYDSRGVDVWSVGEAKLLNDVFHSYPAEGVEANNIVSVAGRGVGGDDFIIIGDSAGTLKKLTLNGNDPATVSSYTLKTGHTSANYFKSVTSDGTRYYAVCTDAIHIGNMDGTPVYSSGGTDYYDLILARHTTAGIHSVKYVKGYIMFGEAERLYYIPVPTDLGPLVNNAHTGGETLDETLSKRHINPRFAWNVIEGGNRFIYAAGWAGSDSEIWAVPFDADSLIPDAPSAIQVVQLPYGEIVQAMQFYLGYLAVGTNKGVRICKVAEDGSVTLGPLLYSQDHDGYPTEGVTGFATYGNYVWASTTVEEGNLRNAVLVRIDLSTPLDDGSFPYAYDLQYQSDENSYGIGVEYADNRLHIITNEGSSAGEIQTEMLDVKRTSGWLQTGKIRYGMIEPKYFKYINATVGTGSGDNIDIEVINQKGELKFVNSITVGLSNQDIPLDVVKTKQEQIAFKFTFNNVNLDSGLPMLYGYQIKATPATRRQRLYQYPLSCFDVEMDRFDAQFGGSGRALEVIQKLESIEQTGKFVTIVDYRVNETYEGIIEEIRFTNESSPDKDSSGFGGLLLVTVRKM